MVAVSKHKARLGGTGHVALFVPVRPPAITPDPIIALVALTVKGQFSREDTEAPKCGSGPTTIAGRWSPITLLENKIP
jgi:hypothetical protein